MSNLGGFASRGGHPRSRILLMLSPAGASLTFLSAGTWEENVPPFLELPKVSHDASDA